MCALASGPTQVPESLRLVLFGWRAKQYESSSAGYVRRELNRALARDHKLTKADLMLTLSDHEHGGDIHQHYVAYPSFHVATIDWHAAHPGIGDISASSMVSDFSSAGQRRIVWHTGPNPCMAVYYPVFFHHDGHVCQLPQFLSDGSAWYSFRYVIYELAREDPMKIKRVQDTWRPIQLRFFQQAEEAAEMASQMKDVTAADALLSNIVANISETIRETLVHLNQTL